MLYAIVLKYSVIVSGKRMLSEMENRDFGDLERILRNC